MNIQVFCGTLYNNIFQPILGPSKIGREIQTIQSLLLLWKMRVPQGTH